MSHGVELSLHGSYATHKNSHSPILTCPSSSAIVAGTAPFSRTIFSTDKAISTFCGYGMPGFAGRINTRNRGSYFFTLVKYVIKFPGLYPEEF